MGGGVGKEARNPGVGLRVGLIEAGTGAPEASVGALVGNTGEPVGMAVGCSIEDRFVGLNVGA